MFRKIDQIKNAIDETKSKHFRRYYKKVKTKRLYKLRRIINQKIDINELNNKVVIFCIPYIFNQIVSHIKWQIDSNSPLIPLPLPETTSMAGKKTLPSTFLK